MKVLILTNLFPNSREPDRGCFNLQQFQALQRHGEVRVIAPVAWRPWGRSGHRQAPRPGMWHGIPATYPLYFSTPGIGRSAYAACMYGSLRRTVTRVVKPYRPDVLLATWAYPDAVAAAAFARQLRLPWVAKVHGSDINVAAESPMLRAQIRWALCQASAVFAVSQPLKQRLVEIGVRGDAVHVQHNGVDTERFRLVDQVIARETLNLPIDRRIVLFVGNLKVSKGVSDLIEASRLVVAAEPQPPLFVFVGGGAGQELLARQVHEYGLADHVLLAGAQPHSNISTWLGAADVLCLPSHQEGCPNVVLEALASGRPVVASRVGAIPEFIDQASGALVPPRDPAQLATALRSVVARSWEPEVLRRRVLHLGWAANADYLAVELTRAVEQQRPAAPIGREVTADH